MLDGGAVLRTDGATGGTDAGHLWTEGRVLYGCGTDAFYPHAQVKPNLNAALYCRRQPQLDYGKGTRSLGFK